MNDTGANGANSCENKSLNLGTFNVRGLVNNKEIDNVRLQQLINDCDRYKVDVCAIQETHCTKFIVKSCKSSTSGKLYNFINFESESHHHGIGFVVCEDLQFTFKKIHERIAKLDLKIWNGKLSIYNIYAPWKNENEQTTEVYNILDSELKTNTKNKFLLGDFNASVGESHSDYPQHVGTFCSGYTNKNGKLLVDLISQNDFYINNTFFKHKLAHINTWTSNLHPKGRRNPIRKQIDFIICKKIGNHVIPMRELSQVQRLTLIINLLFLTLEI